MQRSSAVQYRIEKSMQVLQVVPSAANVSSRPASFSSSATFSRKVGTVRRTDGSFRGGWEWEEGCETCCFAFVMRFFPVIVDDDVLVDNHGENCLQHLLLFYGDATWCSTAAVISQTLEMRVTKYGAQRVWLPDSISAPFILQLRPLSATLAFNSILPMRLPSSHRI